MEEIIVSIVTGVFGLLCAVVTGVISGSTTKKKLSQDLQINQAVMDTKLDELTREVRAHNNFAQRMPVVEQKIKDINRRISDLEHDGKGAQHD